MLMYWKNKVKEAVSSDVGKRVLSTILAVIMVLGLLPEYYAPQANAATALATTAGTRTTLTNGGDYTLAAGSFTNITYTVAANATVTVTVSGTTTINNQSNGGSPFTLSSGSTLNLVVNGTLSVYGQNAGDGAEATARAGSTAGGSGGYAGISVPTGTTLRVSGSGTLRAYGGDAGDGGNLTSTVDNSAFAGGGGGAGAGIGGNGGAGGKGTTAGSNGGAAGTVAIVGSTTKVYAYGGGGGSGGGSTGQDGGGGGGYPAAGIGGGGGGAGGGSQQGGGGFSSGYGAMQSHADRSTNGQGPSQTTIWQWFAGGYFEWNSNGLLRPGHSDQANYGTVDPNSGIGGANPSQGSSPSGGAGGAGGTVYYVTKANVYAYNGSSVTTSTSSAQGWATANQTGIYAQLGYDLNLLRSNKIITATWNASSNTYTFAKRVVNSTTASDGTVTYTVSSASASISKTLSASAYGLGIGTGAGSTEGANGTIGTANAPAAASGLSVSPNNSSGQLVVTWTTPANNGAPITQVEILDSSNAVIKSYTGSSLTTAMTTAGQKPSVTLTGLTNGTSYTYKIRVTNVVGNSVSSTASGTPRTLPSAPTSVTAAANGSNGQLAVGWTTAANNGAAITKVEIIDTKASNKVLATTDTVTGTQKLTLSTSMTTSGQTNSVTVTGLTGGVTYGIAVRVTNAAGSTTSGSVDAVPNGPPMAPTNVTAAGTGVSGQIRVSWTTSFRTGNAAITGFRILDNNNNVLHEVNASNDPNVWQSSWANNGTQCSYVLTGLPNGTSYTIKVAAVNSAGQGPAGTAANSATAYTNPGAPAITSITRGNGQLTVNWSAAANNGATITKYEVFEVVGGSYDVNSPVATTSGATSATITGLGIAESHTYVVRATNQAGVGTVSASATGKTYALPDQITSAPTLESYTDTSATLSWPAGTDDGAGITKYIVRWTYQRAGNSAVPGSSSSQEFTVGGAGITASGSGSDLRYTVTISGLAKGAGYLFTVTPVNAVGEAATRSPESQITLYDQPAKVTEVSANYTKQTGTEQPVSGSVTVSWNRPNTGGSDITLYTVHVYEDAGEEIGPEIASLRKDVLVTPSESAISTEIINLENGKVYYFRVTATNKYGTSELSDDNVTAIPAYMPSRPEVTTDLSGLDQYSVNVTWTEPNMNGGAFQYYQVLVFDGVGNLISKQSRKTLSATVGQGSRDVYEYTDDTGARRTLTITYTASNGYKGREATITGLSAGTRYRIGVVARNEHGANVDLETGVPSTGVGISNITTLDVPGSPADLTVTPTGEEGMFSADWQPGSDGGEPIESYQIVIYSPSMYEAAGGDMTKLIAMATVTNTEDWDIKGNSDNTLRVITKTVEQLQEAYGEHYTQWPTHSQMNTTTNQDGYYVSLRAKNRIGWGYWTSPVKVSTYGPARQIEDVTTALKGTAGNTLELQMTWTDPSNLQSGALGNGKSPITGYNVYLYEMQEVPGEDGETVTEAVPVESFTTNVGTWDAENGCVYVPRIASSKDDLENQIYQDTTALQGVFIEGLKQGGAYRVVIRAVNEAGEGTAYQTKTIGTWTLPSEGSYPTAVPTNQNGELKLTWRTSRDSGDVPGNGNVPGLRTEVQKYMIYLRQAGDTNFRVYTVDGETVEIPAEAGKTNYEYVISGLTNGQKYEMYVAAVNGAGETVYAKDHTTVASGVPRTAAPAPTVGGKLTSGNASAILGWLQAPEQNGGSEIIKYYIYAQEVTVNPDTGLVTPVVNEGPVKKREVTAVAGVLLEDITIPDLVNGRTYRITASSVNGAGEGPRSQDYTLSSQAALVTVGMPEPPTNLNVEPGPYFTAKATFTKANGNGSAIDHYLAYISEDGEHFELYKDADGNVVTFPADEAENSGISVQGGRGGSLLYVKVSAVNRVGESATTEAMAAKIATPTTPNITSLVANQDGGGVTISWAKSNDNGVTMSGYNIYYRAYVNGAWEDWKLAARVTGQSTTSWVLPKTRPQSAAENENWQQYAETYEGLTAGKDYQVMLRAQNLVGESSDSNIKEFRFGVPGAPIPDKNVDFASGELILTFKEPVDSGLGKDDSGQTSGTISKYSVYANTTDKPKVICELNEDAAPGSGETWTDESHTSWTDKNDVLHVKLGTVSEDSEAEQPLFYQEGESYKVRLLGLANGSTYKLYATATNEHGESPLSDEVQGTPATTADAPRDLGAEVQSDTEVTLTWRAPLYNGGGAITEYVVKTYEIGSDSRTLVSEDTASASDMKITVDGLKTGGEYMFQVYARNKAGDGKIAETEPLNTFDRPGKPTITSWRSYKDTTGTYNLEISWRAPEKTGGTPITGYKVWVGASLKSGTDLLSATPGSDGEFHFTITGLKAISYTIRVEAFNSVCNPSSTKYGGGEYAEQSIVVGKIAAPENFRGENVITEESGEVIELKWDAVNDDFAYYRIYDLSTIMKVQNLTLEQAVAFAESQPLNATSFTTTDSTVTSIIDDSAEPGTHYYAIRCFSSQGVGGYLSKVCEITLGGAQAPELISAAADYESVNLTFKTLLEADMNLGVDESTGDVQRSLYGYQILVNSQPYSGRVLWNDVALNVDTERNVITAPALNASRGERVTLTLADMVAGNYYSVTIRAMTAEYDAATETTMYLPGLYADALTTERVWTTPVMNSQAPVTVSGDGEFTIRFREANGMGRDIAGYTVFGKAVETDQDGEITETIQPEDLTVLKTVAASNVTVEENGVLSITVDHIENGSKYVYYLAAYTEAGSGAQKRTWYSDAPEVEKLSQITTGIPGAPEIIGTTARAGDITVTYTEPQMDAALAVRSYQIEYTDLVTDSRYETTSGGTSATFSTGVVSGHLYSVRVRALNDIDYGPWSEAVEIMPGTPSAPEILDYAAGDQTLTVRWRQPQDNGAPLLSYRVYYVDTTDGSEYVKNVDVNLTSVTLDHATDGVVNGVDYEIRVVAINGNGEGQPSEIMTLMPGTVPGAPREATATATGGTSASVSWLEPENSGGLVIDSYQITSGNGVYTVGAENTETETNYEELTLEDGSTVRRYTAIVESLTAGESYQFGVQAHNKRDFGEMVETNTIKTHTTPDAPQWSGISSTNYTFTAMWTAPENDGGSEILGYNVYLDEQLVNTDGYLTMENDLFINDDGDICYTYDGAPLTLGATHRIRISAVNSVGVGAQTSGLRVTIQGMAAESVPGRPGSPTVTAGNKQLTVTWSAPLIEGVVEGVTGYYVRYAPVGLDQSEDTVPSTVYHEIWHSSDTELTETITGLENGTEYKVWVVAMNRVGASAASVVRKGTPDEIAPPAKPEHIAYWNNSTMNAMTITWDPVETTAQGGKVEYDVYVNNITDTPTKVITDGSTSLRLQPVESGVTYKIWVVARNNGGTSPRDTSTPDLIAQNWLNVDPTNTGNPSVNLDVNADGELDPDQIPTEPTAPRGLSANVNGLSDITLTWNTPITTYVDENGNTVDYTDENGNPVPFTDIEYYKIYVNGVEYKRVDADSGNRVVYPDPDLESAGALKPNTIYSFQVSAVNEQGEGETSIPLQVFVQNGQDYPTGLTAETGEGNEKYTKVHLSWSAPMASTPTRYWLQVNGEDKLLSGDGTTTSADYDVIPNHNYVFRVWAQYGDDPDDPNYQSKTTNAVNISTVLDTPNTPTGLAAEEGTGKITLTWTAPEGEFSKYYLYVNNQKVDEIEKDALTYEFTPAEGDTATDFLFNLTAVNEVEASGQTYTQQSAKSNTVAASIREIEDTAPAAPTGLQLTGIDGTTISLAWNAVTTAKNGDPLELSGKTLRYDVYMSVDGGALKKVAGDVLTSYSYAGEDGHEYVFRVCAVIPGDAADGSEDVIGVMSGSVPASTKHEVSLLAAPTGLKAAVSDGSILLTWDPVQNVGDTLQGYAIYLDAQPIYPVDGQNFTVGVGNIDTNAPSYTYTPTDSKKKSFYFQVAAVNTSENHNSMDVPGHSELSQGCSVSLSGDINADEIPAPAAAPVITKSVHSKVTDSDGTVTQNKLRLYWTPPTYDVEGGVLESAEISGYQINIARVGEDGTLGENYVLEEAFHDTRCVLPDGTWYYEIDLDNSDYAIDIGVRYAMTVTATRSFTTSEGVSSEVPGAGQKPWIIMRNLNLDEDGDWEVDKYPDSTGSGSEDIVAGTLVTLTANITAGGAEDGELIVDIEDQTGEKIIPTTVEYDGETGTLKVEYRVMAGSASAEGATTYTVKVTKAGCTYFELTDIPMITGIKSLDLNAQNGGKVITLLAGDANSDGLVNLSDLTIVNGNFNKSASETVLGDVSGDGVINLSDLTIINGNFNKGSTTVKYAS